MVQGLFKWQAMICGAISRLDVWFPFISSHRHMTHPNPISDEGYWELCVAIQVIWDDKYYENTWKKDKRNLLIKWNQDKRRFFVEQYMSTTWVNILISRQCKNIKEREQRIQKVANQNAACCYLLSKKANK